MPPKKSPTPTTNDAESTPSGRPRRTRNAPKRFGEEPSVTKPAPKRKATTASPLQKDPSFLLTNPRSSLAKIDLAKLLADDRAWKVLKPEQKAKILALLPSAPKYQPETVDQDVPTLAATYLDHFAFKSDVSRFQSDLANGYRTPEWQEKAKTAMLERARGDFDDWKEREIELWWGQKME